MSSFFKVLPFLCATFLMACESDGTSQSTRCTIEVEVDTLIAGQNNSIAAYPLTDILDTLVLLDDDEVKVTGLNKSDCAACEECKLSYGCSDCDFCATCQESCSECSHHLEIEIDATQHGTKTLSIYNVYGSSDPIEVQIESSTLEN